MFQSISAPESAAAPAALERALPTLGHALQKWAVATGELLNRVERSGDGGSWLAARWKDFDFARPLIAAPGTTFHLSAAWNGKQWWLQGASQLNAGAWNVMRWLLHLPGLRAGWVQALRAERYDRLLECVPSLWHLDETEPPPGTVIAGLGAASWAEVRGALALGAGLVRVSNAWFERELVPTGSRQIPFAVSAEGRIEVAE